MKTCRYCLSPIVGRTKRAQFCSPEHKEAWHAAKAKAETATRLANRYCLNCGGPILSRSGKAQTCSRLCSVAWQNKKRDQQRQLDWEANKQPCAFCGGVIPDTRRRGTTYCSIACKRSALSARWRAKAPGYMRQYLYGVTPVQFKELLYGQGGRCAICRTDTPGGKG